MIKKTIFTILISLVMCGAAYALEPMRIKVRTELPSNITRVGEAAQYYAYSIGYKLVTQHPAPEESFKIASEAISPYSRKNTVLPIEEAILDILSTRYVLVIDDEHKLFSFERGAE